MNYHDLRDFIKVLDQKNVLKKIQLEIDPYLEMTEISDRILRASGPALIFENPKNHTIPVLTNLFGTTERVAWGLGLESVSEIRDLGNVLAFLKEPKPPKSFKDALNKIPLFKQVFNMNPKILNKGICQQNVLKGAEVDLEKLPIQTCWPLDKAPLITWGLVITEGPNQSRQNLGIYRQQVIARNKVIMRWLPHRGGALDYEAFKKREGDKPFPVSVVLGSDPATLLAAVTPVPDDLSEYSFAGLLRGNKTELVKCLSNNLQVPANAEIILEGFIYPNDMAEEGPFGDHTGYYNEVQSFPVLTVETITLRDNPIYHSTYTGKPPDEPAVLGIALNELFVPLLQKQFPEICDFYLPAEGCSYRVAVVSIRKQYPAHAKRVMMGIWSFLRQFMYTKFVIVVDEDIDIRDWNEVIWAISTRMDPKRDSLMIENTPIDYLDFASPEVGLGSKMGLDATHKWPSETTRIWGTPIEMSRDVKEKIDQLWNSLLDTAT